MHWWYLNFDRIKQRCVQFGGHKFSFILLLLQFLFRKKFQILAKTKSFRALIGTIDLHSNSGTSFMSMVIKGMVRNTNEDRQLLSSLAILIIPLTDIYTTIKPRMYVCMCVCHVYAGHLPIDG